MFCENLCEISAISAYWKKFDTKHLSTSVLWYVSSVDGGYVSELIYF